MPRKSELSVQAAVLNCLARCADSAAPLTSLGEFLDELSQLGWDYDAIRHVSSSVIHLLGTGGGSVHLRLSGPEVAIAGRWAHN
jgi:hypothetical protein